MSHLLVRRRYACAYETGPRPLETLGPPALTRTLPVQLATAYGGAATDSPVVGLTYDDGPDPAHTPRVLDALRASGVRATFFVLLERAERHPDLVARAIAEGHEVGLHGGDHRRVSTRPLAEFLRDLRAARSRLRRLTGRPVRWYRPAYGAIRLPQLMAARAVGLDVPVWTAWARDWEDEPVAVLADRAARSLHPGGILLLHDATAGSADGAAPLDAEPTFDRGELTRQLLEAAAAQGYRPVTLRELAEGHPQARVPWFETAAQARAAEAPAGETRPADGPTA